MTKPSIIQPIGMTTHVFIGVFGEPGIGKTRLVGTSPGKTLIIRPAQDHLDSLLPSDKKRAAVGEIEQAVISDWDDMDKLLEHLRSDGAQYNWVWLDSLSLAQDVLIDDIWDTVITEKPARARYGLDKSEYGINMDRIGRWLRHVVGPDLFNFGFTAHPAQLPSPDLDSDGDPVQKLMPWVQGKNMANKCCGYMNVVAFMEKAKIGGREGRRVLRTESSAHYYAKDQFDAFGGRVVDPTMPKLEDLIKQSPGRTAGASSSTQRRRPASRRRVVKGR